MNGVTYFCFDSDERVIYVGTTISLRGRIHRHRANSPWWPTVAAVTTVSFDRWEDAAAHEKDCIAKLRPIHNKIGNPDWRPKAVLS